MAHRKWKASKQQPSMLPGLAVPGCCLREVAPENQPSMLRWGQRIFAKFAPDVDIGPKPRHENFFRNFLPRNWISGPFYPEISRILKNFR